MTNEASPIRFDEDGSLLCLESVTLDEILTELSSQLAQFLSRVGSCDRSEDGGYLLTGARTGQNEGVRVLWENVALLASLGRVRLIPPRTPEQEARHREELKRTGVAGFNDPPVRFGRNTLPLSELLRDLHFAILWNETDEWRGILSRDVVARIRRLSSDLEVHRQQRAVRRARSTESATIPTAKPAPTDARADLPPRAHVEAHSASRSRAPNLHDGHRRAARALAWLSRVHPEVRTYREKHARLRNCPAYEGVVLPKPSAFERYVRDLKRMQSNTSADDRER